MDALSKGMKQGVDILPLGEDGRGIRVSNNAPWYQEYYKEHGKAPNQAQLRDLAYLLTVGDASAPNVEGWIPTTREVAEAMDAARGELDELNGHIKTLENIKERMMKVDSFEVKGSAGLSPEGYKLYRQIMEMLEKIGGEQKEDKQTKVARMNAMLFAHHADIFAAAMRTQEGKEEYTALDYFKDRFALRYGGTDMRQNGLYQSATNVPSAEKDAVRKQYEGTAQWMKAPNGKPTNLTEDQWIAVRTPAFKAWFGDWEQAARLMLPRHAENLEEAAAAARSIAGKRLTNDLLGMDAFLSNKNIGKMVSASATRKSVDARVHALAVANVDRLFSRAITEYTHKDRDSDKNIKQIHRVCSPFVVGDNVFVAKLTVKELVQEKEGNRLYSVEALEIKEASRKWNAAYNATEGVLTSFPQEAFDNIIARFLPDGKNCSKIVDGNGEPLVVYHGSDAEFEVFDRTKGRSGMDIQGMFFSPWDYESEGYGKNVRAFFLNIKNPATGSKSYEVFSKYESENYAGIKARDELEHSGYDGVVSGDMEDEDLEFIAFEPNQIKSATDNNGAFSPDDANIYHQINSLDNGNADGDNESRISDAVFQKYLNDGIMEMVRDKVSAEIAEHVNLADMADPIKRDAARDRLPYIREMLVHYNDQLVQNNPAYKNRMAAKIEYARRCFDNDPRIQHGDVRPMDGHSGQRGVYEARQGTVSGSNGEASVRPVRRVARGVSRAVSGERSGARAHFDKLYNDMQKHLESQGAFSMLKQMLRQEVRGEISQEDGKRIITLFESADESTFMHEMGHMFLISRSLSYFINLL